MSRLRRRARCRRWRWCGPGWATSSSCDAAELGTSAQAEALIGLEQAEAQHTAARARLLAAFSAQQGHQADGQYGPAAWLRAVTRVSNGAAGAAVKWARRLAAHPLIAAALAAGQLSSSWAKALCQWTDQLPEQRRADADAILLAAAGGGAGLADLGALAQQMIERSRTAPDRDKDTFGDRAVWLETTIGGAGRLSGDLTGPAAAAVAAVLAALGARSGTEDTRTLVQRQHDALTEACRRLIESGMLPGPDSQPAQLTVHVDLAELRGQPAASGLEAGWSTARAAAAGLPGSVYVTGPDAQAAACDAALTTMVSGHIDWALLDQLTSLYLQHTGHTGRHHPAPDTAPDTGPGTGTDTGPGPGTGTGRDPGTARTPARARARTPARTPTRARARTPTRTRTRMRIRMRTRPGAGTGRQERPGTARTARTSAPARSGPPAPAPSPTAPGPARSAPPPANGSSTPCCPGASACCPGPPGSPPPCAATCCPPGSPACPSRSTSAAPPE